jgi:hypothetical protein
MYCDAFTHGSDEKGHEHVGSAKRFGNHDQRSYLTHGSANSLSRNEAHSRREKLHAQRMAMMHHKGEKGSMAKRSAAARAEIAAQADAVYESEEEERVMDYEEGVVVRKKHKVQRRKFKQHLRKHGHSVARGTVRLHESTGSYVSAEYLDGSRMTAGGMNYRSAHGGMPSANAPPAASDDEEEYEEEEEEEDEEEEEEEEYEEEEGDEEAPPAADYDDDDDSDDAPPPADDDDDSDDAPPPPADDDDDDY